MAQASWPLVLPRGTTEPKTACPLSRKCVAPGYTVSWLCTNYTTLYQDLPSACQMGHSVWAFCSDRCEFYRPKSVLKTAGALYVCLHGSVCGCVCLCMHVCAFSCICRHVLVIFNMKYSFYVPSTWVNITYSKQRWIKAKKNCPISNLVELPVTSRDMGNLKVFFHY